MKPKKVEIKNSKIGGRGSFALEDINKGDLIRILTGETISREEINKRIKAGKERPDDPLDIGENNFIDLDYDSLYFNHSCNPNAAVVIKSDLIAIRLIKKGEEITFDYSMTANKKDRWEMICSCGSINCRKKIGTVITVPKNILRKYINNGWLQDFIKKQVNDYLNNKI